QYGRHRQRRSYARIREVLELPNLIEIQTNSYEWFLREGLREMFHDISPISDFTGNLVLEFIDYSLGEPKYSIDESKERDVTYSAPLRVKVRLQNKETGELKEQEVFMGDFPLMTESGTFIINGAERVIVSQLVRSPSVYYNNKLDKNGKRGFSATVIPNRGAWLELETDAKDIVYVRIDRTRKIPVTVLLRALGFGTDQEIIDLLGDDEYLRNSLEKDNTESTEKALIEIYERLRPGEPPTVENAKALLVSRFFDPKRYDLANVGRYKINKKLHLKNRLFGQKLAETLVDPETGEVIAEAGTVLDRRMLDKVLPFLEGSVGYIEATPTGGVTQGEAFNLQSIKVFAPDDAEGERIINIIGNGNIDRDIKHITPADMIAAINYFFNLLHEVGTTDDIDHLGNRRLRSVGELLQNQFRIGLSRMERVVKERMSIQDQNAITPQA
ncbi:MAG: DNA-directed RNA polymerase subunit beta, partial [Exiguobacterium sp.]